MGGGWQGRGFGSGGILGGYGRGYSPGGGYNRGYRGYGGIRGGYGLREKAFSGTDFGKIVAAGEFDLADTKPGHPNLKPSEPVRAPELEVGALCFEKWRLIEQSRLSGAPEYFSYVGLASPFIRKQLVLFPNQTNIHISIENELRRLGVHSETKALADALRHESIKKVIDYYIAASKDVLGENKDISGMIITKQNRILCADAYSSPSLFKKMFSQLMQSAAIGACLVDKKSGRALSRDDIEEFLLQLKNVQKIKNESSQSYRLFYPRIISGAELYSDKDVTRVVHLEAYPR